MLHLRKTIISADTTNTFNSSRIKLRYLTSFGTNGVDNNCAVDDSCTAGVTLENADTNTPTCDLTSEKYKVCAKREDCTRLNIECVQNEIDMQAAKSSGSPIDSFLLVRKTCNEILLPLCNLKKGYTTTDSSATITDPNPTNSTPSNPNAYGWFNELCISSGFETRMKNVLAYASVNGIKGKCLISPSSPYLTDGDSSTNCDYGGKAPNCLCIEAVEGVTPGDGQEIRPQTSREAGLCIDMPAPQTCSAIDYNTSSNSSTNDPDYILSSLNNTAYGNSVSDITGKVHISHKYRTNSTYGHAEFPLAIMGMVNVEGECKGFWQSTTSSNGTILTPKLSCLNNNGSAIWDTNVANACVRYSCPEIATTGPDESGLYQGGYGWNETGENKGLSHGFATWTKYTQTSDFPETSSANACITGFKKSDSVAIKGADGKINSYSGGNLPTRQCNQLGQWQTPTNACVRISCAAINPPIPSSSNDTSAWAAWNDSGGATFPATNASRSLVRIQSESIATGTCNNSLGFFNMPGGAAPTRECDSLGNWGEVKNPCTTTCDAITDPAASNSNNGYSYWSQITGILLGGESDATASGCVDGYYPYPYPAPRSKYGVAYSLTDGTPNYTTTIPHNVANDSRSADTAPRRVCKSVITVGGTTNVWTATSSSCINACPGYSDDARIGVGATQHPTSSGTITIQWPSTSFGQTAYITLPGGTQVSDPILTQQDASNYASADRATGKGYYILARYCNPTTHKWDDAKPQCAANNGTISEGNAVLNNIPVQTVDIDASPSNPSCVSSYYKSNYDQGSYPIYACKYKDSNKNIDEVYYQLQSGEACEQYCSVTVGQTFGTGSQYLDYSSTPVTNNLVKNNTQLTLACLDNYGAAITGTKRTSGVTYNCGLSPYYNYVSQSSQLLGTYRSASAPYSICNNGTWGAVVNDCSACLSCDFSAGVTTYSYDKNGDGQDNDSNTGDSNNHSGTFVKKDYQTGCCDTKITTKCDFNTDWMQNAPTLSNHQCGRNPQYSLNGDALISFTSALITPHNTVIDILSTDKNSCGSCERHLDAEVIMKCIDGNAVVTTNAFSRN